MSTADTGTDFYDRSLTSRRYALVGVVCATIFSCLCIVAGIVALANHGIMRITPLNMTVYEMLPQVPLQVKILTMILDLIVMLCTESIGFVHGLSLRSALAAESRLRFNPNLRLLTAARGWYNPNGALLNGISAVLLIISYSSASLVITDTISMIGTDTAPSFSASLAIVGLPLLVLGVAILLQVMIALSGMRAVKILTWSSSPFDLTAALVHHTQLVPATFRCMRRVSDLDTYGGPAKPPDTQPPAWHAHPSIRKVNISLWVIVAACAGWAALTMYICDRLYGPLPILQIWSFFQNEDSPLVTYLIPYNNDVEGWTLLFVNIAVVQAPLTLGLHCSELIVNVIRDEKQWRCATRSKGLTVATNPLKSIFTDPICLILFVAKPFLRESLCLEFLPVLPSPIFDDHRLDVWAFVHLELMYCALHICLFLHFHRIMALRRPSGPQPAAYGHLQTLADLVDEWSPVMW
ncbi:uncharacterized protein EDB93DRAFT_1085305 [Suillus bovinus]|uniref:uncharacterized protein n=1 Tax=Suillus bovinus TaxID=48563 RepID=UPI001B885E86|nr:uncharacterized protein EDB93DRAFT_1085305 [Suillus bovinus]KAG2147820.1 hypothetical protein EDB93DRAFT_1085305 [Suillus bovinus]